MIRDRWGIPHIYARSEDDLFFAQGFVQAQDRLFQMELWRRQTQGRLAELLGPEWVERDRLTRLVTRYRGNLDLEWASYGPGMRRVAERFVAGINARVDGLGTLPPLEFSLAGLVPEHWAPEDLLARAEAFGMSGNAQSEVSRARLVQRHGFEAAQLLRPPDPAVAWSVPPGLNLEAVDEALAGALSGIGAAPKFGEWRKPGSRGLRRRRQQQLGGGRRANGLGPSPPRQRPAPRPRPSVAALPRAPRSARPAGDRRGGALVPGHRHRPQRSHRLGPHDLRHRRAGPLPGDGGPPGSGALPRRGGLGADARRARDHPRQGCPERRGRAQVHAPRAGGAGGPRAAPGLGPALDRQRAGHRGVSRRALAGPGAQLAGVPGRARALEDARRELRVRRRRRQHRLPGHRSRARSGRTAPACCRLRAPRGPSTGPASRRSTSCLTSSTRAKASWPPRTTTPFGLEIAWSATSGPTGSGSTGSWRSCARPAGSASPSRRRSSRT